MRHPNGLFAKGIERIMANLDITDKIGFALLKKGIIDYETLEKSLKVKESEEKKNRRNLGQILVNDFKRGP